MPAKSAACDSRSPIGPEFGFAAQMRVGDAAVAWLAQNLMKQPDSRGVLSVEGNKDYQQLGVDLLWVRGSANGREYVTRVESKGDTHSAKNFYLETVSAVETNQPGCILTTTADFLAYVFLAKQKGYLFQVPALRTWLLKSPRYLNTKEWKTVRTRSRGNVYTSHGIAVPVEEVLAAVPHDELLP